MDCSIMRHFVGDWEGDAVWGGIGKGLFARWAEGKIGYYRLALMRDKKLNEAILKCFSQNPELPIHTVTLDNGVEFSEHEKLSEAWNTKVFFAHPTDPGSAE